jgi:hypothetical protein
MVVYNDGSESQFNEVEFVNNRKNQFAGWQCEMGKSHIFINKDWLICHATCNTAESFATVETFETLPTESMMCKSEYCMCTADVMIPKYR